MPLQGGRPRERRLAPIGTGQVAGRPVVTEWGVGGCCCASEAAPEGGNLFGIQERKQRARTKPPWCGGKRKRGGSGVRRGRNAVPAGVRHDALHVAKHGHESVDGDDTQIHDAWHGVLKPGDDLHKTARRFRWRPNTCKSHSIFPAGFQIATLSRPFREHMERAHGPNDYPGGHLNHWKAQMRPKESKERTTQVTTVPQM